MLRSGPSNLPYAASAQTSYYQMTGPRTLPPLPIREFADAAFTRKCGVAFAVKLRASPERSFNYGLMSVPVTE